MDHRTVRENYLSWIEDRLRAEERRSIQEHLDGCGECRLYFEKMTLLMGKTDATLLPHLSPDPYLAARIRALAKSRSADSVRVPGAFRWVPIAAASVALVAAVTAGVYLGKGLSARVQSAEESSIVAAYYEAFSPSDFASGWEGVVDTASNGAQEASR